MKTRCPHCGSIFSITKDSIKKKAKCRKCNESFYIEIIEGENGSLAENLKINPVTVEVENHIQQPKRIFLSDKILRFSFSIANNISAFIVSITLLCILIIIVALIFIFLSLPPQIVTEQIEMPTFADFIEKNERQLRQTQRIENNKEGDASLMSTFESNKEPREKKTQEICSRFGLDMATIDQWLESYENDYVRDEFISGLEKFLSEAEKYYISKGRDRASIQFQKGAKFFKQEFDLKMRQHDTAVTKALEERMYLSQQRQTKIKFCLMGLVSSIGILLLFLLLPLLIQIEKNTRAFKQFIAQDE